MTSTPLQPLLHTRILSLALNLPGPAALLCEAAGLPAGTDPRAAATHEAIAAFAHSRTRAQLDALAVARDIPLHTLA